MAIDPSHKLGLSIDPASLQALKSQSHNAPDASLKTAAKQFEGVFLNMMLKSMRDTVPQDGPGNSQQTKMFQGMLDEQYASALSQGRGLGLADMIVRQFKANGQVAATSSEDTPSVGQINSNSAISGSGSSADLATALAKDVASSRLPASTLPKGSSAARSNGVSPQNNASVGKTSSSAPASFKDKMADFAASASQATGIPAHFLLAQAGLESGWGKHQPLLPGGNPSYNLFGIKAGPNWNGPVVKSTTTEVINGVEQKVVQSFRAYSSYAESFHDYASLLSGSARYAKALASNTAQDFSNALQKAGYATDPAYAQKIRGAIKLLGGVSA